MTRRGLLRLALPSKGRLAEPATRLLSDAGIQFVWSRPGSGASDQEALDAARQRLELLGPKGYTAYKSGPGGKWRGHEPPAVRPVVAARVRVARAENGTM